MDENKIGAGHLCAKSYYEDGFGRAVEKCWTDDDGRMFVVSPYNEYLSQVNFCPFCGQPAPVKVEPSDRHWGQAVAPVDL